jgi:hypothetical protein
VVFTGEMALTTFRAASIGDGKGFGCQLIVGGAASGRAKAAERWSRAVSFVNSALRRSLQGENVRPAPPHRHVLDGVHLGY